MPEKKQWFVIYTKPRWEKKVNQLLLNRGVETYCPVQKLRKKWSDRMKTVDEPLFKSYVFVCVDEAGQTKVRMTNGVVNFVYWLGKPAIVRATEIEVIRKFLNEYENVKAEPIDPKLDQEFRIKQGLFMDKKATVIQVLNNKVKVNIESIGYSLVAFVDKSNLSTIEK